MKSSKFIRQFSTHFVALVLGVALAFSSLRMLSSQAKPAEVLEPPQEPTTTVALKPGVTSGDNFVAAAVANTGPAVVRLDTTKIVTSRSSLDPFFDDPFFRDFFGDRLRGTPQEREVRGQGSGFITDNSGIILTNAHVVSGADKVTVTLKDGRQFEGEVKGSDPVTDLAVVKIEPQGADLPIASLGNSGEVQVGDWAIAVGNPLGLNNTVTLGIISTLDRSSAQVGIPDKRVDFLQTDAAINPGNSGGPLLNDRGEVIGINTAIRANATGIGFAIPINKAKALKDTLAAGKEVPHPYVGIQMITLNPELAQQYNQNPNSPFFVPEEEGVLVVGVLPDTPAASSGIRRGDVILKVAGQRITSAEQLQSIVEKSGVGATLRFEIKRGDNTLSLNVRTAQLESIS